MQVSRPVLIGLSLLCVLCVIGLGLAVRDIAFQLGAGSSTANFAMILAMGALVGALWAAVSAARRAR